jgi:hypothetical protein
VAQNDEGLVKVYLGFKPQTHHLLRLQLHGCIRTFQGVSKSKQISKQKMEHGQEVNEFS